MQTLRWLVLILACVTVSIAAAGQKGATVPKPATPPEATWEEGMWMVTNQSALACDTHETMKQSLQMQVAKDWEAVDRLVRARRCTTMPEGQAVMLQDAGWGFRGLWVQVRARGQIHVWWISKRALVPFNPDERIWGIPAPKD